MANIRRYLAGVGATNPGGPAATTGSAQGGDGRSGNHRALRRRFGRSGGLLDRWQVAHAERLARVRLTEQDGIVPHAAEHAWEEYLANRQAARASAFPDSWDGIMSSSESCGTWYSLDPSICGAPFIPGAGTNGKEWFGKDADPPSWVVANSLNLVGIRAHRPRATASPHLPTPTFSLHVPKVGVEYEAGPREGTCPRTGPRASGWRSRRRRGRATASSRGCTAGPCPPPSRAATSSSTCARTAAGASARRLGGRAGERLMSQSAS